MKVIIEGQLVSIFLDDDFKNPDTGEISKGKHKLQLLVENELFRGTSKNDVRNISIPEAYVKEYEAQIGKKVQVKCDYSSKTAVSFFVKESRVAKV